MLKNNAFSQDDDGERTERVLALSENIDSHAVELGIVDPNLAACQTAGADWTSACTVAGVEDGESQEATETLNNALEAAHGYYVDAKDVLLATIYAIEKPDEIIEEYGVKGDAPWDFTGLQGKILKWLETDSRLTALVPPDPRVVNPAIIAGLTNHLAIIVDLWHDAREEKREKSQAYAAKQTLFDNHSKLLTFVFSVAKMTWGKDDPRLVDLGMVPKSQIWTPGSGEPEPGVEGVPWPGPMARFEVNLIALPLTTEIIFTRIFDCPRCVLERELEGSGMWEYITEYNLEKEEILPFRDKVPYPGKWRYRATPFNKAGEMGIASEGTIEVV